MPRENQVNYSFWLDIDLAASLDALAVRLGLTRSETLRLAITQFVLNETNNTDRKESG
jgi:predicted transcriptional regulator